MLSTQFLILWIYFSSENQEKKKSILGAGAAAVFCLIVCAKVYKSSSVPDPARSWFQSTSRWLCTTFSLQTVGALPDRPVRPFFTSLFPSHSQFYIHRTNIQLNGKMHQGQEEWERSVPAPPITSVWSVSTSRRLVSPLSPNRRWIFQRWSEVTRGGPLLPKLSVFLFDEDAKLSASNYITWPILSGLLCVAICLHDQYLYKTEDICTCQLSRNSRAVACAQYQVESFLSFREWELTIMITIITSRIKNKTLLNSCEWNILIVVMATRIQIEWFITFINYWA